MWEDHLPPQKYIKNSSACGTTPPEHILNADRGSQTSKQASQSSQNKVRQKINIKKETKYFGIGICAPGREL